MSDDEDETEGTKHEGLFIIVAAALVYAAWRFCAFPHLLHQLFQ